ncbi:MAG TPA: hypothetical protein IAC11_03105 [Candidatus Limiplasma pullicola]|nr:hypothetical protein [Candidatus Limiplasma pullicola]
MKRNLSTGVCVLIALALVAFGLTYGTLTGFGDERAQVEALWSGENGLSDVLSYRGADGLNLCVVARRHLPQDDPDVLILEESAGALRSSGGAAAKKEADTALEAAFEAVARKLESSGSFQASERDQRYLSMLEADLNSLGASQAVDTYYRAASAFNDLLAAPLTGALARLLGVSPCELYE